MAQAVGELPIINKLKKEIEALKYELRTKLPKEIEAARAHGDLKENAEYHAAKERQGMLNARIGQLAARIRELSLYNLTSIPHGVVAYGSKVTLEDLDSGESLTYEIVFPEEADANVGTISLSAPLGRAMVGKAEGDEIEVQAPRGKRSYQIVKLETMHDRTPTEPTQS